MAVEHDHNLIDADPHFSIDTITRAITNTTSKKVMLMQYDHNSERFSFDIDRNIEGHDVLDCDAVHIHFCNINSSSRDKFSGVYTVEDLQVHPADNTKACFTWLISENATQQVGTLNFLVTFSCMEDDELVYRWSSGIHSGISISTGMNNGEEISETYADVLLHWENEIKDHISDCEAKYTEFTEATVDYVQRVVVDSVETVFFASTEQVQEVFDESTAEGYEIDPMLVYKDDLEKYEDLPSDADVSDVYYVAEHEAYYVFNGTVWRSFGSNIDTSAFATASDLAAVEKEVNDYISPWLGILIKAYAEYPPIIDATSSKVETLENDSIPAIWNVLTPCSSDVETIKTNTLPAFTTELMGVKERVTALESVEYATDDDIDGLFE